MEYTSQKRPLSVRKKILFGVALLLFFLVSLEISFRSFLALTYGTSFFKPSRLVLNFYPELRELIADDDDWDATRIHILLLGASALHEDFGNVEELLNRKLEASPIGRFAIHNLSQRAHTTRDSLFKHQLLADKHFDIVVVYHGINEVRANNCPREIFSPTYSHYSWYELLDVFDRHRRFMNISVIPYSLDLLFHSVKQILFRRRYIPMHGPRAEWVSYGSEIKTAESFARNISTIIKDCREKSESVVLMTFAYYLPANYSLSSFGSKKLYSGDHGVPVEVWGSPPNVVAGLRAHNAVIRRLAKQYPDTFFIDMEKLIPKETAYFADVCHLTDRGCEIFADRLADMIVRIPQR